MKIFLENPLSINCLGNLAGSIFQNTVLTRKGPSLTVQQYQGQVAEMLQNGGTGQISLAIDR